MKRYQITVSGVTSIASIKSISRTGTVGQFTISTSSTAKNGYNDPALYITGRVIPIIPGSKSTGPTTTNTLITNDGIVVVYLASNLVEVVDLFEAGNIDYTTISPEDYSLLINYVSGINPMHRRVFAISGKDENDNLIVKNNRIYTYSGNVYFQSDMDLDLPTDSYGFYEIDENDYTQESIEFKLIKKQFYLIDAPSGTTMFFNSATKDPIAGSYYWFNNLDIDADDKYLTFNLRNSSVTSGTIIIY